MSATGANATDAAAADPAVAAAAAAAMLAAILEGPVLPPPNGTVSNFTNPENSDGLALGVFITCVVIATIAFVIRIYEKVFLLRKFMVEEALTAAGYVMFIATAVTMFILVGNPGYFVHSWDVQMFKFQSMMMWILVMGSLYAISLPLVKTAILIEWCRMFVPTNRYKSWFWWSAAVIIFVQLSSGIVFTILLHTRCDPYAATYDPILQALGAKCRYELSIPQMGSGVVHLISDVAMLLLPQPIIWGLKMDIQKKIGVSIIFASGVIACVSAAARVHETATLVQSTDPVFDFGKTIMWVMAEMCVSFVIICVPCMPKFLKETGIRAAFKKAFNMPITAVTGNKNSNMDYYANSKKSTGGTHGMHSGAGNSRLGTVTTDARAYYQLDEEHQLKELKTESTEHLREGQDRKNVGVVRTTRITVQSNQQPDAHSDVSDHSGDFRNSHHQAWSRKA